MAEGKDISENQIGPSDSSPEASQKRFEERQRYPQSPAGQSVMVAKLADKAIADVAREEEEQRNSKPDEVQVRKFFGIPVSTIEKWFKR